jgi:hypothetical protein
MKTFSSFLPSRPSKLLAGVILFFLALAVQSRADLIELINGDHYRGVVLGMTLTNIDFLSEIQGRVRLPRDKVAQITFREVTPRPGATNRIAALPTVAPGLVNQPADSSSGVKPADSEAALQQLRSQGLDPKLMDQIQQQIFGKASPEAAQKFNELLNGLKSGSISVADIRAQAQDSIKQIREAKKELGGDAGDMLDSYLVILEKFVADSGNEPAVPKK